MAYDDDDDDDGKERRRDDAGCWKMSRRTIDDRRYRPSLYPPLPRCGKRTPTHHQTPSEPRWMICERENQHPDATQNLSQSWIIIVSTRCLTSGFRLGRLFVVESFILCVLPADTLFLLSSSLLCGETVVFFFLAVHTTSGEK